MTETGIPKGREWLACPSCDALHRRPDPATGGDGHCHACGHKVFSHPVNAVARTLAFALSGLVLFIPANVFPLVSLNSYGARDQNQLITGPLDLLQHGMPGTALLVFLTSMVFPALMLFGLAYTAGCVQLGRYPAHFARVLRMVQGLLRWSMVDVYILACMVAFIKLADLAQVTPQTGLYALGGVLACTVLATLSFDPMLMWDRFAAARERSAP